jgi:hypothetical protein
MTPVNHHKAVCQSIYSVLRSVKPHARYTSFGGRNILVVPLIVPYYNYGNVLFSTVDATSKRRLNVAFVSCLHYVHKILRQKHASHLVPIIIAFSLETLLRIHLLTFLFKVHLFTLFHFTFSTRTRNLIVTPHRSFAMGYSFTMGACGL